MKTVIQQIWLCIVTGTLACHGQGFVNLGFESATVSPLPPGQGELFVSASNAFPGWQVYKSDQLWPTAVHNDLTAGSASTSILGPSYSGCCIIEGNYTAVLQPGDFIGGGADVTLAQTAEVPGNAYSLQFKLAPFSTNLTVSLGGQSLSYILLQTNVAYKLYGADVSRFAGYVAELRFTGTFQQTYHPPVWLDGIQFSAQPVPEPSMWALLALGSALFGYAMRRRKN